MAANRIQEEYLFPNSSVYGILSWDIPSVKKKNELVLYALIVCDLKV